MQRLTFREMFAKNRKAVIIFVLLALMVFIVSGIFISAYYINGSTATPSVGASPTTSASDGFTDSARDNSAVGDSQGSRTSNTSSDTAAKNPEKWAKTDTVSPETTPIPSTQTPELGESQGQGMHSGGATN